MAVPPRPPVNIISLCTGGYGLDFGVELAMPAARSICLVEREAFAVARLVEAMRQGLIPEAAIWSDARTFNGRPWRGLVDGVIGGIPCQPHSLAGRRLGVEDPRDLWSAARRTIVQSKAWWCLIENVPGMLSANPKGRGKRAKRKRQIAGAERVWRDLQRLGFAVEGGLFSAAEVGASHERERLFILGVANGDSARSSIALCRPGDDGQERATAERIRGDVVDTASWSQRAGLCAERHRKAEQQSGDGRRTVDVPARLDRQVDEPEERFAETDDRWSGLPLYPPSPEMPTDGDRCSSDRRNLNPLFVEWLMGWPPGWTSFACSATALCLWRQRMRSVLLSLALRNEAPPAQLSLAV